MHFLFLFYNHQLLWISDFQVGRDPNVGVRPVFNKEKKQLIFFLFFQFMGCSGFSLNTMH